MSSRLGRNTPCPCGSGKKYKRCCLGNDKTRQVTECPICQMSGASSRMDACGEDLERSTVCFRLACSADEAFQKLRSLDPDLRDTGDGDGELDPKTTRRGSDGRITAVRFCWKVARRMREGAIGHLNLGRLCIEDDLLTADVDSAEGIGRICEEIAKRLGDAARLESITNGMVDIVAL